MVNTSAIERQVEILLVEDSPSDAYLMLEILSESILLKHLHTVHDGVEALKFLHRQAPYECAPSPALILLDLNLPKLNGVELLTEIKTDPILQMIPVIVLTTSAAAPDILKSYKHHANCYILKPLNLEEFIATVQAIVHFWLTIVILPSDALTDT